MKRYSDWLMFAATLDTHILVSNYSISSPVSAILSYSASYLLFLSLVQYQRSVLYEQRVCATSLLFFSLLSRYVRVDGLSWERPG